MGAGQSTGQLMRPPVGSGSSMGLQKLLPVGRALQHKTADPFTYWRATALAILPGRSRSLLNDKGAAGRWVLPRYRIKSIRTPVLFSGQWRPPRLWPEERGVPPWELRQCMNRHKERVAGSAAPRTRGG